MPSSQIDEPFEFDLNELLMRHSDFNKTAFPISYEPEEIVKVCRRVKAVMAEEPTLLEVSPPLVIVGDLHGQYQDLHRIFSCFSEGRVRGQQLQRFLFLGDYVDRGSNGLEVIMCLMIHKLAYPVQPSPREPRECADQ
ncbi:hypothetical protein L596_009052 [Steinernema carpocapsae]|uniref:Calcineurin-like phosphoesterase domain-containing protein n=1 Tax=Steinernema carpocapsae TaxID=34508 RepID=A0A4U5PE94_STECR|nr:hypothetical protein L596_009052 [Steinernema carpocapsae]